MDRSLLGRVLIGLGVVLVAAGVVVMVIGDDDTNVAAGDAGPAGSSTTLPSVATTPSSSTPSSTSSVPTTAEPATTSTAQQHDLDHHHDVEPPRRPTTGAPVASETTEEFFAVLKGALDGGDAVTLLDRMNQATLDRYGADQCESYAASVAGTGLDATLLATDDLASWDYTTDEVTTTITGVVAADLERTVNDQTVPQTTHWQLVDGRYTWFTDCGSPV